MNLKEMVYRVLNASYIVNQVGYDSKFDEHVNFLIDVDALGYHDERVALFTFEDIKLMVWIGNFPYGYGHCYNENLTDTLQKTMGINYTTRYRLRDYIELKRESDIMDTTEYQRIRWEIAKQKTNDLTLVYGGY